MSLTEPEGSVADSESQVTEISLLPDGRIALFGASQRVLELLDMLQLSDPFLKARLSHLRNGQPVEACREGESR